MEKKFHSLRTQYSAELKIQEKQKSGAEGDKKTKWRYMDALSFLRQGMKIRQGVSTEVIMVCNSSLYLLVMSRHFSALA